MVFGADTWLHVTTETVSITRISALEDHAAPYSLSLISPDCTTTNNTIVAMSAADLVCTMAPSSALLTNGAAALQTLNNQSNAISVLSNGPDPNLAYLTVTPSDRNQQADFSAKTFGMRTSCQPITSACNMSIVLGDAAWNCSRSFAATLSEKVSFVPSFFNDKALTDEVSGGVAVNPFYYAVANTMAPSTKPLHNLANDTGILQSTGVVGVILLCEVEVFDLQYDVVQGNVVNMVATTSNISVANVFEPALEESGFGAPNIQNAFNMAAAEASSAQDLADMFSLSFSKIALSVGAGSLHTAPALAAKLRQSLLVAKVPKAPLFLLVVCNFAFVVVGIILAVAATMSSPEAREVQSRLSIAGVVAYMFDGETARAADMEHSVAGRPEKLFAEHYEGDMTKRIGIGRGDVGGFEFKTLDSGVRTTAIEIWRRADVKLNRSEVEQRLRWI